MIENDIGIERKRVMNRIRWHIFVAGSGARPETKGREVQGETQ
jgi:hypothetical protein